MEQQTIPPLPKGAKPVTDEMPPLPPGAKMLNTLPSLDSGIPKGDPAEEMLKSSFIRTKPKEEARRLIAARSRYFGGLDASKQDELLQGVAAPEIDDSKSITGRLATNIGQNLVGLPTMMYHAAADEPTKQEESRHERHPVMFGKPERGVGLTLDRIFLDPQLNEYNKSKQAGKSGEYSEAAGHGLAAVLPGAGPMAAGLGEKAGRGEFVEALGDAGFMYLSGLFAHSITKEVAPYKRLAAASGGGAKDFEEVVGDLAETAKKTGKPKTLADLDKLVKQTGMNLQEDFNRALIPFQKQEFMPSQVSDALLKEAERFDDKTAEGRSAKAYLKRRALDYQKPWTLGELNEKRMKMFNAGLEAKTQVKQYAAKTGNAETLADKTIENSLKDIVYDHLEKQYKGAVNFRLLKEKQSRLMDLKDRLEKQVEKVADDQAKKESAGPIKRAGLYIRAHASGVSPALHPNLEGLPEKAASKQIKKAFNKAKATPRQSLPPIEPETPPRASQTARNATVGVEDDAEMARRGASGEPPAVKPDEKVRTQVADRVKEAKERGRPLPKMEKAAEPEKFGETETNTKDKAMSALDKAAHKLFGKPFKELTEAEKAKTYSEGAKIQDAERKKDLPGKP